MHPTQLTGDRVILKQSKRDMLTPEYDPQPYTVIGVKGKRDHGEVKKRKGNQITKRLTLQSTQVHRREGVGLGPSVRDTTK